MAEVNHTQRVHALLSASGSSRWLNCTPSPVLEEQMPDLGGDSSYAREGTLAHEFGDIGIRFRAGMLTKREYTKLRKPLEAEEFYYPEMDEEVEKYISYVIEQYTAAKKTTKDALLVVEDKIDLTDFIEDGFGTCDAIIIADGTMDVNDLKFGKGIRVDATDNSQLKLYGLGCLMKYGLAYDIDHVRLTIVQPRLDHISSWTISADDLLAWGEEFVEPRAQMAYEGQGEFAVGDWCKWCKAKPKCPAKAEYHMELLKHEFENPELLPDEQVLEIYKQQAALTDWANSVVEYILKTALEGKEWEGYKLVAGRSIRKFADDETVIKVLYDAGFTEKQVNNIKLKGLGDLEKLLGKAKFETILGSYVVKPEGKPTLAPVDDKRPALGENIKGMFED